MGLVSDNLYSQYCDLCALRPRDKQAHRGRHDLSRPGDRGLARDLRDVHVYRLHRRDRSLLCADDREQDQTDEHVRPNPSQNEVQLSHVRSSVCDPEHWLVLAATFTAQIRCSDILPYHREPAAGIIRTLRMRVRSAQGHVPARKNVQLLQSWGQHRGSRLGRGDDSHQCGLLTRHLSFIDYNL